MALRFLAEHCISNTIVQTLRDGTHEVVRLRDVLPAAGGAYRPRAFAICSLSCASR